MKRRFPIPSFRPSETPIGTPLSCTLRLRADALRLTARTANGLEESVELPATLTPARSPERTPEAARAALAKLGGTDWMLADFTLDDPDRLFAPASLLNEARRQLVDRLDAARLAARNTRLAEAAAALEADRATLPPSAPAAPHTVLKVRLDRPLPADHADFDEIVIVLGHRSGHEAEERLHTHFAGISSPRLALPVFTAEGDFNALRSCVKHLLRAGYTRWEASDLATLRLLRQQGVTDLTADWTLYAFNRPALAQLAELGVTRFTTSPETTASNRDWYARHAAEPGLPACEFLAEQSTPLFISLTRPAAEDPSELTGVKGDRFTSFPLDGLWITVRPAPRVFPIPRAEGLTTRVDRSWDATDP